MGQMDQDQFGRRGFERETGKVAPIESNRAQRKE
jgi:hypothetical protein